MQESANLKAHVDAENKKAAKLTQVNLTAESVEARAISGPLSNDAVMKLGDKRLTLIIKLAEHSVLKYWKDMPIPKRTLAYRHILRMAKRSFPCFEALPGISGQPRLTKTRVTKDIGIYLRATKGIAKHIYELSYGKSGLDKTTQKMDGMCEVSDLMEQFFF